MLCSASLYIVQDMGTEDSDAAQPSVTLTANAGTYSPEFVVSPWNLNEYNSINYEYVSKMGSMALAFSSSWSGAKIPGITISPYGGSVQSGNSNINGVNNGNGTCSHYFKLSGTPTSSGTFDVRNQVISPQPPQLQTGMCFNFTIVGINDGGAPHTEHNNKFQKNGYQVYASSSIELKGVSWKPGAEAWCFEYRMAGTGSTIGYSSKIQAAAIQIEGTENKNNMEIEPGNGPTRTGSAPTSNNSTNYNGIANTVVNFSIIALNSMGASFAWTVADLLLKMGSNVNRSITTDDYVWRLWDWSPSITETGQFLWFEVDVKPNQMVKFSYEYMIFGQGYDVLSAGKGFRTVCAGSPDNKSLNMNPEQMTPLEREKYGIEIIYRENLSARAIELNLSDKTLNEWQNSNEDIFYYAHKFIEYETPQPKRIDLNESTLTKDLLLSELSDQIDASKNVIRAFSSDDTSALNDSIAIIQKHVSRLLSLQNLQEKIISLSEKDYRSLNSAFNKYREIIGPATMFDNNMGREKT